MIFRTFAKSLQKLIDNRFERLMKKTFLNFLAYIHINEINKENNLALEQWEVGKSLPFWQFDRQILSQMFSISRYEKLIGIFWKNRKLYSAFFTYSNAENLMNM